MLLRIGNIGFGMATISLRCWYPRVIMNLAQPRASVLSHVVDCPTPVPEQPTDCPQVAGPWHAKRLDATQQHPLQSSAFIASFIKGTVKTI